MPHMTSADGTAIGYDRLSDNGPVVILVSGGLDDGPENLPLGQHLADQFTAITYRRRGRGDSGDTQPYALQREIEDLAAVIEAAGGRAHLFGASPAGRSPWKRRRPACRSTGSRSTKCPTSSVTR